MPQVEVLRVMTKGQRVFVEVFDHEIAACRLFEIRGVTALVCSEAEWTKAQLEHREPECLGWPLANVRESKQKGVTAS